MQELWNGSYSWLDWVHHVDDCHSGSHEGKSHMDRDDAMKHVGNGAFMTPVTASCACLQQRASESHKEFEPRLFAGGASLKVKDNHGKKNHSNRGLLRDCKEGHMDLLGSQAISQKNQQRRQDSVDDDCYTWCRAAAQSLVGKDIMRDCKKGNLDLLESQLVGVSLGKREDGLQLRTHEVASNGDGLFGDRNRLDQGLLRDGKEGHFGLLESQATLQSSQKSRHGCVDDGCYTWCRASDQILDGEHSLRDRKKDNLDLLGFQANESSECKSDGSQQVDSHSGKLDDYQARNGERGNLDPLWFQAQDWAKDNESGEERHSTSHGLRKSCMSRKRGTQQHRHLHRSKVHFNTCVSLVCFQDESDIFVDVGIDDLHQCCRSLWHLHGQSASFDLFPEVLACHSWADGAEAEQQNQSGPMQGIDRESNDPESNEKRVSSGNWGAFENDLQGCLQWDGALEDGARPVFADTWFVSEGRFHLCIQPRRLRLDTRLVHSADYFERRCRELWRDRDDGSAVRFQVIDNGPMRLPSTKFHIVLIQGELMDQQWTMLHSIILPPLYRHRVVIFPRGSSVSDFFRTAQVEGACSNLARSCFVKFHEGGQIQTFINDDRMEVPQHRYVEGGIRVMENEPEDGEVSGDGDSEMSTNVPDSELDDGVEDFSLINLELTGSNGSSISGSLHGTDDIARDGSYFAEDGNDSDLVWSWVSSHKQHQAMENVQTEEDEILSLMATDPLANHVHNPWQQPWNDVDDGVNEMELAEEEGISISFAHNQMETTQQHIEHILADVLEEQQDDIWTVVTFGLGLVDLGRRDTTAHPRDMDGLMRNVLELWEDHAQYGDLSLYCVSPQPMDIAGEKSIVLIVKVEMQEPQEPSARCVLVLERAVSDTRVRPQHYAAFLSTHSIMYDLFRQLHLQEHCPPYTTRDCGMRLGMTTLNEENVYDFEHGTFCLAWIGPRPEEVVQAMQRVGNAEEFFVQFFRLMSFQPEREHVTFAVHGISPANRPLGRRDGIFSVNEVQSLVWIDVITQLWPFDSTECTISFVPDLTADMQELGFECFNFIVSYGGHDEAAIVVHQQLGAVEEMPHQSSTVDEFWALRVPRNCIAHNVPGAAFGPPFWFRYARSQNVYPHLFVEGQRAREVQRNWQDGDVLIARFHVWQRHHILAMLLREGAIDENDRSLEETSFLQQKSILWLRTTNEDVESADCTTDVFTEICHSLRQQVVTAQDDLDGSVPVVVQESRPLASAEKDAGNHLLRPTETITKHSFETVQVLQANESVVTESRNCSVSNLHFSDPETSACLDELNRHLSTLMLPDWQGLNTDFAFLPTLHPFAEIACQWTGGCRQASGTFHVFTDGSCRSGKAAWAFVVLCEQKGHEGSRFVRVGYAAGRVQEDIGPCEQTAQDAEATAIIAAVEFLLSRQNTQIVDVHLHFDATAVGYGIVGKSNLIQQDHTVSARQWSARVLMSILQRKHRQWYGYHVHAHQGHPWNEFVDSLAGLAANGWLPHVHAVLRSGPLLRHCLAEWAWMQVCPNNEIPSLEEVLVNSTPQPGQSCFDDALKSAQEFEDDSRWVGRITFASANVCTLEQDQVLPGTSVTYKAAELMQQFQDAEITIVGIQESRARLNGQHTYGPFTCLVAAGDKGQAGVELWINGPVLSRDLRIDFNPREDVGVIHATARIMVVQCHFGQTMLTVVVAYAPQRGRGEHEIGAWWGELRSII